MVQEINPVWENFTYIFLLKIKKIFLVIKLIHIATECETIYMLFTCTIYT